MRISFQCLSQAALSRRTGVLFHVCPKGLKCLCAAPSVFVVLLIIPLSSAVFAFALAPTEMQHQWHTACIVHPAPLCSCVQLYISWIAMKF